MTVKNNRGFTLIELLVVIAILGILTTIAVPKLTGNVDRAKETVKEVNSKTLANIIQIYNAEQQDPQNMEVSKTISALADISKEELIERIPADFDWSNVNPVYIDENGNASITDPNAAE